MAAASMAAPSPAHRRHRTRHRHPGHSHPGHPVPRRGRRAGHPVRRRREVDAVSTGKLAAGLAGRGMAAVLVNGTTGEAGHPDRR